MKLWIGHVTGWTLVIATLAVAGDAKAGRGDASDKAPAPDPVLVGALLRCSLDAEALAAAGVSAQGATSLVNAVRNVLAGTPGAVETADASYASARSAHDALERKVRAGIATPAELTSYATAKTTLAAATSSRDAILDSLFTNATQGLTVSQRTTLTTIRANRAQKLPIEYLAATRTQAQWVSLRDALATKAIAARYGEPLDAATQQAVAAFDAEGSVVAAKAALASGLGAVTTAWNLAVAQ